MNNYQKLYDSKRESFTAYHKISTKPNNKLGLIFLGGFKSDMNGTKALAINAYAERNNYDLIRFDYFGHGNSSGEFTDCSIDIWLKNTLRVIDELTDKPQILIGSSMGGWLMLLAAMVRPHRVAGLVGLAAAPDFTEELIWDYMTSTQKEKILKDKIIDFSNEFCEDSYPISHKLIEESRQHLLLSKKLALEMPIHLIHGMEDKDVPYKVAIRIAEAVSSNNVKIHLLKGAGHRLSEPNELEFIYQIITSAINECSH